MTRDLHSFLAGVAATVVLGVGRGAWETRVHWRRCRRGRR